MTTTLDPDLDEIPDRESSGRTVVVVAAILAVALMLAVPVRSWLSQRARLDELQSDNVAAQQRLSDLQAQRDHWQDPVYVEQEARARLNYVRRGEAGLIVLHPQDEAADPRDEPAPTTWYGRLWRSTESATGGHPTGTVDGTGR